MKNYLIFLFLVSILLNQNCSTVYATKSRDITDWNDEIIYHVFQRSFYDSNGDRNGDLNGLASKLDYLKKLGVTAILCTPLYESDFYHNYFAKNYDKIDPEYGTMDDYLALIKAVHRNGMKFIMDMETQYAQNGNTWFDDSYKNPGSNFTDFICYSDSLNLHPEQFYVQSGSDLYFFKGWPDLKANIVYLNLNSKKVKDWTKALCSLGRSQ
jgi:alpha-amylase